MALVIMKFKINNRFLRLIAAVLISFVVSVLMFVVVGLVVPVVLMNMAFGSQEVHDAPGHGSAILLVIAPIAALISFIFMFGFIMYFYEKLTD